MRLNLSLLLVLLAISTSFISCQDHRLPQAPRFRLKKSTSVELRSLNTTTYNYNSSGQLTNYVQRFGDVPSDPGQTVLVNYDSQGRLFSIESQPVGALYAVTRSIFGYDVNGNIVSIKQSQDINRDGNYTPTFAYRYEYGSTKFPIKKTAYLGDFQSVQYVEQYTYDNGNIIRIDQTNTSATYKFDDRPNPFYGLILSNPGSSTFNKNNIIGDNVANTYDSNGLLIKSVVTLVPINSVYTYEYESY